MPSAAKLFYLAVFSLLGTTSHGAEAGKASSSKTKNSSPNVCAYEPHSIVSDACASYSTLDHLNENLLPPLRKITQYTDFFSHYRLNLYHKKCPFWSDENGMCGNIACAVNTLDNEEDIPLVWRADELGKLEGPKAQHPGRKLQEERPPQKPLQGELGADVGESCVVEYDDECDERDYCVPEDERASSKGDYVSLVDNPERFTGYAGAGAQQVWEAIYRENCFYKQTPETSSAAGMSSPFGANQLQAQAAMDLRNVMKSHNVQQGVQSAISAAGAGSPLGLASPSQRVPVDDLEFDQECLEKRVFHRVVSGMHASISTHLCWDFLNQTTGTWAPNVECYERRLASHPERIANVYFNYALLLRAVAKLERRLAAYSFCSQDPVQDLSTKGMVLSFVQRARALAGPRGSKAVFDESVMFRDQGAELKDEFRTRFRNVSRIMDCVGCDKCRLWGKVQTQGYGTALKVLFELADEGADPAVLGAEEEPPLRRTELVALFNTLGRVGHSLRALREFRGMLEAREGVQAVVEGGNGTARGEPEKDDDAFDVGDGEDHDDPESEPREDMFMDAVRNEWDLVWRTFKFVIRGWVEFPRKLWDIIIWESARMYHSFVGLQGEPPKRNWEFRVPKREEL